MSKEEALEKLVKTTDKKFQRLLKKFPRWNAQYLQAYHDLMDWYEREREKIEGNNQ